jgi:ParB-like chromosome segregation protein Spo0J
MVVERALIADLLNDPRNARVHDSVNIESIKVSLRRFKQQKPIVVGIDNVVIAGNGTLVAASELGWKHINVVRSELAGDDATAYGIADNRTAELARWDYKQVAESIRALELNGYDVEATGFSKSELENILGAGNGWAPPSPDTPLSDFTPSDQKAADNGRSVSFSPEQWALLSGALGTENLAEQIVQLAISS